MQKNLDKNNRLKRLHKTIYPCSGINSGEPLVLLPGWSFDSRIWQDLIKPLQNFTQVITLDLPGFGDNSWASWYGQEDICEQILQTMPPKALYLGWSLGGMLATQIAVNSPDRVVGLITLATNSSFIKRDSWPYGMSIADFKDFYTAVDTNPEQALKRFRQLLSQGDQLNRKQAKWLQTVATQPTDYNTLLPSLSLLKDIDNSDAIPKLQVPGLHIFGEQDRLVPLPAVQKITDLSKRYNNYRQQYHQLSDAGHLVFWPGDRVISLIETFLASLSIIPSTTPSKASSTVSQHHGN